MSYTKTVWRNNQAPAINADNLNHIEQGIESAHNQMAINTSDIETLTTQVQGNASNIVNEISARQSGDSLLQSQIDQIIAPSGEAPSAAEVENARIGDDGVTYDTLGNAIRGQFADVKSILNDEQVGLSQVESHIYNTKTIPLDKQGYIAYDNGSLTDTSNARNTGLFSVKGWGKLACNTSITSVGAGIAFYDKNKAYLKDISYAGGGSYNVDIPATAYFAICSYYGTGTYNATLTASPTSIDQNITNLHAEDSKIKNYLSEANTEIVNLENYLLEYKKVLADLHGYRFYTDGSFVDTDNARCTKLFPVNGWNTLSFSGSLGDSGAGIAFYDEEFNYLKDISYQGGGTRTITIPSSACYASCSVYSTNTFYATLRSNTDSVLKKETDLLQAISYDIPGYINPNDGGIGSNNDYRVTDFIEYVGDAIVIKGAFAGPSSAIIAFYDSEKQYISGSSVNNVSGDYVVTTVPQTAKYFRCGSEISEGENPRVKCVSIKTLISRIKALETDVANSGASALKNKNVLIFGDSITDCCTVTVNEDKETTAYAFNNPSNTYINGSGVRINYSMWPKILNQVCQFGETRNYAHWGATYLTASRESGLERQNLQYQIDVALNDVDNPNNVFQVAHFIPDIVIFALGINDGVPADTYTSAMNATVLESDNTTIDVDATIANLDDTKSIASARKAFMRIKKAFPLAQIYCVIPLQTSYSDRVGATMSEYLKQMAERYGVIIINGASMTGITRDFNTYNGLGVYLKDGLHPNEVGQNLIARTILKSLSSHYVDFSASGFNQ